MNLNSVQISFMNMVKRSNAIKRPVFDYVRNVGMFKNDILLDEIIKTMIKKRKLQAISLQFAKR